MQISAKGVQLIKKFEGFVPHTYTDKVGKLTIGYGSTKYANGTPVKKGDTITEPDAAVLMQALANDKLKRCEPFIRSVLKQNQIDAIASFIYNIGTGIGTEHKGFINSTVLRRINKNPNDPLIANAFNMWIYGHDEKGDAFVINDLVKRRKLESSIYLCSTSY